MLNTCQFFMDYSEHTNRQTEFYKNEKWKQIEYILYGKRIYEVVSHEK
jgi:hypothetical protein